MDIGKSILLNWAKKNNCDGIEAVGREGMSNWLTENDSQWTKNNLLFEMQFNKE
jgi:hypothetical protein